MCVFHMFSVKVTLRPALRPKKQNEPPGPPPKKEKKKRTPGAIDPTPGSLGSPSPAGVRAARWPPSPGGTRCLVWRRYEPRSRFERAPGCPAPGCPAPFFGGRAVVAKDRGMSWVKEGLRFIVFAGKGLFDGHLFWVCLF